VKRTRLAIFQNRSVVNRLEQILGSIYSKGEPIEALVDKALETKVFQRVWVLSPNRPNKQELPWAVNTSRYENKNTKVSMRG